jgi:hypothetical protein
MACPDTTKPATEPVSGLHSVEQLGGELDLINTRAVALRKHFAIGYSLAASLAPLIWGVSPR